MTYSVYIDNTIINDYLLKFIALIFYSRMNLFIHSLTSTSCRDKILCNGLGSKGKITILESVMKMFEGL